VSTRILVLDIETSPALIWGYGLFNQNHSIGQIEREPDIIGWASRWEDEPARTCTWYDGPAMDGFTDSLNTLWDQLNEATHVLHFNGKSFDTKWVQQNFVKYGIRGSGRKPVPGAGWPPSPFKEIDLLLQIRGRTRNISNKLDYVSRDLFGLEGKMAVNAMTQWLAMYHPFQAGDMAAYEKAREKMARYCKQDVNLLPRMKKKYLPWMNGINVNLYSGHLDGCPNCPAGVSRLQRRGFYSSGAGNYQRYRCMACGTWSKSNRSLEMSTVRNAR
jgi:hypothetical protein